MKKIKRFLGVFMTLVLTMTLMPVDAVLASNDVNSNGISTAAVKKKPISNDTLTGNTLNLSDYYNNWVYQKDSDCYAMTGVVYCSKPINTTYQSMNIYVPAAYMNTDGTLTDAVINGYTAETAPIIYINGVGGYSQAAPAALNYDSRSYSSYCTYLKKGYVVVSVGCRGKQTQDSNGTYIGKSPEGIVDLKAGVRFLKYNDAVLAGDSKKIVSIGTSAGGALSSLLGATGNSKDYLPYLKQIGAIMTEGDDIYGAQSYCPITDIENADMAYEWMYQGENNYSFMGKTGTLTDFQQALSTDLAAAFPGYVNKLKLDPNKDGTLLTLDKENDGTYYNYLIKVLQDSLSVYLTNTYSKTTEGMSKYTYIDKDSVDTYITSLNKDADGNVLKTPWVSVSYGTRTASTGPNQTTSYNIIDKVTISSLNDFNKYYCSRGKMCPAFDDLTLSQAENEVLGSATINSTHFDTTVADLLKKNASKYAACALTDGSSYNYTKSLADAYSKAYSTDVAKRVALLNPMNYITRANKNCNTAPYFRIRAGTQDNNTSFTVAMNLALALETYTNSTVDYSMIWNQGHGEADYEGGLISWIERICKTEAKYTEKQIATILNLANSTDYTWKYDESKKCYSLNYVVDVANPELPDYEGLSITVPAAYMNNDGTINYEGSVNGYTAATAPIIVNTGAAGYSASTTNTAGTDYLDNGYINVAVGNRGKQNTAVNAKGETYYCGDAPYCLVDQKSAVRWLKYNIVLGNIPGCADRIVTKGGSGGGSHAIMMAATGNNPDFYPYLEKTGAIMSYMDDKGNIVKISDAVFACDPLSPITSLEEANIAYEWEWSQATNDQVNSKYLSTFRKLLSENMSDEYINYINSLGLKDNEGNPLTIDDGGKSGTYVDYFEKQMIASLEWYLNNLNKDTLTWCLKDNNESYAEAYIKGDYYKTTQRMGPGFPDGSGNTNTGETVTANGTDLSNWISIKQDESGYWTADFKLGDFLNYAGRSKNCPSFDDLNMGQAENQEFGDYDQDCRHWDRYVLNSFTKSYSSLEAAYSSSDSNYSNFASMYSAYKNDIAQVQAGDEFGKNIVKLYNPLRYITDDKTELPKHVRIITGTKDTDTSLTISMNCYLEFIKRGVDSKLGWSWDEGHCGASPLNTSFESWLDGICGNS